MAQNIDDPTRFSLDSLGDLGRGRTRKLVDAAITQALDDCRDRAAIDKPRKVVITLALQPEASGEGQLQAIAAAAGVKVTLPADPESGEVLIPGVRDLRSAAFYDRSETGLFDLPNPEDAS